MSTLRNCFGLFGFGDTVSWKIKSSGFDGLLYIFNYFLFLETKHVSFLLGPFEMKQIYFKFTHLLNNRF